MRKPLILAALLSVAAVGGASAQTVVATDPFTGAAYGTNTGIAQGAAVAGPIGAIVGAPIGFVTGAVAGTVGAVGAVTGAVLGAPAYATAQPAYSSGAGYRVVGYVPAEALDDESLTTGSTAAAYGYRDPGMRAANIAPRRAAYRGANGYRRVADRRYGGYRVVRTYRGESRMAYRGRATGRMAAADHRMMHGMSGRSGRMATYRSTGGRGAMRSDRMMHEGGRNY